MNKPLNWTLLALIFNFGKTFHPMNVEDALFRHARTFSEDYTGGEWTVETINGFPVAIPPTGNYEIGACENYYEGTMDNRTFGVALTLWLYNMMIWQAHGKGVDVSSQSEQFYRMKEKLSAGKGIDAGAVYGFLD